jgi:hypothetical protein
MRVGRMSGPFQALCDDNGVHMQQGGPTTLIDRAYLRWGGSNVRSSLVDNRSECDGSFSGPEI